MVEVVKVAMNGLERDSSLLWKLLQVEVLILWQGSLSLILPEGRGMDTMTSGSPSDLGNRPFGEQLVRPCQAGDVH